MKTHQKKVHSTEGQQFTGLQIKILCCHYWKVKAWQQDTIQRPYWKLYWMKEQGGEIIHSEKTIALRPDCIYLIPHDTLYHTRFWGHGHRGAPSEEVKPVTELQSKTSDGYLHHLFMHFTLGLPFDTIEPDIIEIQTSEHTLNSINKICSACIEEQPIFSHRSSLRIYTLISKALAAIPMSRWKKPVADPRVSQVLDDIDHHIHHNFQNSSIAEQMGLTTNSAIRLFKKEVGISIQNYILKRKIECCCVELHHSHESIEHIAKKYGFCDRYYFSRAFKNQTGYSPAQYRKGRLKMSHNHGKHQP